MRHHCVGYHKKCGGSLSEEVREAERTGNTEAFLVKLRAEMAAEEEEFLGHVLMALESLRNNLAQKVTGRDADDDTPGFCASELARYRFVALKVLDKNGAMNETDVEHALDDWDECSKVRYGLTREGMLEVARIETRREPTEKGLPELRIGAPVN